VSSVYPKGVGGADVLEVMRCVLFCVLEVVEGGLCLLEVLEVLEVTRCVLVLCIGSFER
jgi:hypothetical protein